MELAGFSVPRLGFFDSFGFYITILIGVIVIGVVLGFIAFHFVYQKRYNKNIEKYENISGRGWTRTATDKARTLRLSKDGTEVFWLKKHKMPLTAYGQKIGYNTYAFAVGEDGAWYNVVLTDLDTTKGVLDLEPIDKDVRMSIVSMLKNAQQDFAAKATFLDKYGSWIFGGLFLIIMLAGLWFISDNMASAMNSLVASNEITRQSLDAVQKNLGMLDQVCNGGSGIVHAR